MCTGLGETQLLVAGVRGFGKLSVPKWYWNNVNGQPVWQSAVLRPIIIKLCLTHLKTRINNTIFIQLIVKANVEIGFYFDIIQWTSV